MALAHDAAGQKNRQLQMKTIRIYNFEVLIFIIDVHFYRREK
jgi:hypothetical protein